MHDRALLFDLDWLNKSCDVVYLERDKKGKAERSKYETASLVNLQKCKGRVCKAARN
jgi:hypothetical protein